MTKTRKARSDSVRTLVGALQDALEGDVDPPDFVKLRDGDAPFWVAIVRARAKREWTDSDLIHAANLARCMADIERISGELLVEGDVVINLKGTQVVNPKHTLMETLSRRAMAITKLLQMQPSTTGKLEDKVKARVVERGARETAQSLADELIPTA